MFKRKNKLFYREYLSQCGWGVMLGYDTIEAVSVGEAKKQIPQGAYCDSFETIAIVQKEHIHLPIEELSKLYGQPE